MSGPPPSPGPSPGAGGACVEVTVPAADVDEASGLLWAGPEVTAVGEAPGEGGGVVLVAGLTDAGDGPVVQARLGDRWPSRVVVVDDDSWLDAWRTWAGPVRAGHRVVVHPAWLPLEPVDGGAGAGLAEVVVVLDPGRAFGSGSHPSTRLVLAAIEDLVTPSTAVLDVGCGSGVLAVAALRLGAARAVGVDIDPAAVEATTANAARNGVTVDVSLAPVDAVPGRFDLVLANIGAAALRDLAPALLARLAPAGHVVLSGLLAGQADDLLAHYAPLTPAARPELDGWEALVLHR